MFGSNLTVPVKTRTGLANLFEQKIKVKLIMPRNCLLTIICPVGLDKDRCCKQRHKKEITFEYFVVLRN